MGPVKSGLEVDHAPHHVELVVVGVAGGQRPVGGDVVDGLDGEGLVDDEVALQDLLHLSKRSWSSL